MGNIQPYQAHQSYLLELDEKPVGRLFSVEGGSIKADIVTSPGGFGGISKKHLGSVSFEDIKFTVGAGMSRTFYDWLVNSIKGSYARKNGAVVSLDFQQKPAARLEFTNALLKSIVFPKLDSSDNTNGSMTVTISPELLRRSAAAGNGKVGIYASALPPAWKLKDFRLTIDGFEKDCRQITKIDSVSMGSKIADDFHGDSRTATKHPGTSEFSDITFSLPEKHAEGLLKWADDFMVKGNNMDSNEKTGNLEFLAPSAKAYFGIDLSGIGIAGVTNVSELQEKTNRLVEIRIYCESMKFRAEALAVK